MNMATMTNGMRFGAYLKLRLARLKFTARVPLVIPRIVPSERWGERPARRELPLESLAALHANITRSGGGASAALIASDRLTYRPAL